MELAILLSLAFVEHNIIKKISVIISINSELIIERCAITFFKQLNTYVMA